jgi:PKHD-type hydroxylase
MTTHLKAEALVEMPTVTDYITYPYITMDGLIDNSTVDLITQYCDQQGVNPSTLGHRGQNTEIRLCDTKFHYINNQSNWIFDILEYIANTVNDKYYQFDLLGFDRFQYTVYNQPGAHYTYHSDMVLGPVYLDELKPPRKLSFSLILSDNSEYQGGDFEVIANAMPYPVVVPQQKGRVIAFPSYVPHRVSPLISGVRKSIVVWALGPKFK